jgi:ABC-type tungstate transport system permease subunit
MNKRIIAGLLILLASITAYAQEKLTLSTTTSTYETGLLDYMLEAVRERKQLHRSLPVTGHR